MSAPYYALSVPMQHSALGAGLAMTSILSKVHACATGLTWSLKVRAVSLMRAAKTVSITVVSTSASSVTQAAILATITLAGATSALKATLY